jgi:Protein of unknown function (DUF4230)
VAEPGVLKWKIATIVSTCALVVVLAAILLVAYVHSLFGIRMLNSNTVVTRVQSLKQLVTVRYSIERVVGLREPKAPIGEESILLMVEGEALAGVDLDAMRPRDIARSGSRRFLITLPSARLFDVFLNEKATKVWDRQITWWTPWIAPDPDLEHKARLQGLEDMRNAALKMGILDQAQKNAQAAIRDLLAGLGAQTEFKIRPLD